MMKWEMENLLQELIIATPWTRSYIWQIHAWQIFLNQEKHLVSFTEDSFFRIGNRGLTLGPKPGAIDKD